MGDIIVIAVILAAVALAVWSLLKDRKKGGCSGCSGCSGKCSGSCAGCKQQQNESAGRKVLRFCLQKREKDDKMKKKEGTLWITP